MNKVIFSKKVQKQLMKLPCHIVRKLQIWAGQVEDIGITGLRRYIGYHDEPLKGDRKGQRSIRLSKSYRAFYVEHENKIIIEVLYESLGNSLFLKRLSSFRLWRSSAMYVIEVNKHEY
ncbi:conserved hypothetical protein [Desulfamplus magnetovallimortis]|uniref:Addiction module toxin RelE n=1 Tax=Desulfamplus magnetovallimortis TaxID=1246637 RepID=A0A1W1HFJ1_9BACT|nr:conserved hypothetical protein [Desulfamplus magnetovallimortis]